MDELLLSLVLSPSLSALLAVLLAVLAAPILEFLYCLLNCNGVLLYNRNVEERGVGFR